MFEYAKRKQPPKGAAPRKESDKTSLRPGVNSSGASFGDARIHYNSGKPVQMRAAAYTPVIQCELDAYKTAV